MMRTVCITTVLALAMAGCSKKEPAAQGEAKVVASGTAEGRGATAKPEPSAQPPAAMTEVPIVSSSPEAVAAYRQGRELLDNARRPEAMPLFEKALSLDPGFAQDHAMLAELKNGDEAKIHADKARQLAVSLPEAARLDVERVLAQIDGDLVRARATCEKLSALVPSDRRPLQCIANIAWQQLDLDGAATAFEKAIAVDPKASTVYNSLAYIRLAQRKYDDALSAIDRYVALAPAEPNPHDSKAEILMAAGRHPEAEAEFMKAIEMAPQFGIAWQGVAITRFLRGDWAGGRDALAKEKAAATEPRDKNGADIDLAMSWLAAGKPASAVTGLADAATQAEAIKASGQYAEIPILQSFVLVESGKGAEALKALDTAAERIKALPKPAEVANLTRFLLVNRVYAEAKLGKPADAEKSLAALRAEAAKVPDNRDAQSNVHMGAGLVAWAKKDVKGAIAEFQQCEANDALCHWQLALAQDKAGDKAGATATRTWLRDGAQRNLLYVYIASKLPKK